MWLYLQTAASLHSFNWIEYFQVYYSPRKYKADGFDTFLVFNFNVKKQNLPKQAFASIGIYPKMTISSPTNFTV